MVDPTRLFLPLKVTAAGGTDIGKVRRHNEDAILLRPDLQLFILADGAGGHNAGNVASALATTAIANFFEATGHAARVGEAEEPDLDAFGLAIAARRLAAALQKANDDILDIAKTSNKLRGMGTTAVAVSCFERTGMIHVAHVGDSRCYRWRDGVLELLTHDHSLLNDALELRPNIDDAALAKLPQNVVTRALGMEPNVRISVRTFRMLAGDKYLLCSDGLSDFVDEDTMSDLLAVDRSPEELTRGLIGKALECEARDNIAALVVKCALAPNAVAVPRAMLTVRRPSSMPPPGGPSREDDPEIVIVSEDETDGPHVHVVPAENVDESTLELLEDFSKNR
ncbi:MAG TPA: protein phosphatase 2C domain-containing protein [Polyangiaceae bacterium]|jgi:protein phosphatase